MVEAGEDMLNAEVEVDRGDAPGALLRGNDSGRPLRRQPLDPGVSVGKLNTNQRIGNGIV